MNNYEHQDGKLSSFMCAAVPFWIAELKKETKETVMQKLSEKAKFLPEILGSRGEILLFGGGKKGESADLFNQVAESIALMSFLPGGITIFGSHWESENDTSNS